jgi:predicted SAM-dependent methyltransferase
MPLSKFLHNLTPPIVSRFCHSVVHRYRRQRAQRQLKGQTQLHLGCGGNILKGWANIDRQDKEQIIHWDLTTSLPLEPESISLIFSEHFIEHISLKQAARLFADCHRALQPEGLIRVSTPNLRTLVDEYLAGKTGDWHDVGWSPATPCQMVNEGLHLWGHQFVYDFAELKQLLESAGFREVQAVRRHDSTTPALRGLERRPDHGDLIVEARK